MNQMLNTEKMLRAKLSKSISRMNYTESKLFLQVQRDTGQIKTLEKKNLMLQLIDTKKMRCIGKKKSF